MLLKSCSSNFAAQISLLKFKLHKFAAQIILVDFNHCVVALNQS